MFLRFNNTSYSIEYFASSPKEWGKLDRRDETRGNREIEGTERKATASGERVEIKQNAVAPKPVATTFGHCPTIARASKLPHNCNYSASSPHPTVIIS